MSISIWPYRSCAKKNGRANTGGVRGFWNDYGDEAVVIKENWVLLDKGNGKYTYRGTVCKRESEADRVAQKAEQRKLKAKALKEKAEHLKQEKLQAAKCNDIKDYKINGDGTVADKSSGLMWKQCAENNSGKLCDQYVASPEFSFDMALQHVKKLNDAGGFAGHTDWRLPTINELLSIVKKSCGGPHKPMINQTIFHNVSVFSNYVTSTMSNGSGKMVNFGDGKVSEIERGYISGRQPVRLVRSGSN